MTKLQKPPFVFMNGTLTPWDDAKIHVSAEAVIRGISVFEGIKGYWNSAGTEFSTLELERHFRRLQQSAAMLRLPFEMSYPDFLGACHAVIRSVLERDKDLWLRPTVLPVEGHWGIDTKCDLAITAYTQPQKRPDPIDVGISSWQRPADNAQPARIKSAANYTVGRTARMEGSDLGYGEMVLLNQWGRVAEATGSAILVVRRGKVITPPPTEGCLESITVDIVEIICRELGIDFVRRPVDRSELSVVDEMCIAGTLAELAPVRRLEWRTLPAETPVLNQVADLFWKVVRRDTKVPGIVLTSLPGAQPY